MATPISRLAAARQQLVSVVLMATGIFADAYDLFCINLVMVVLKDLYAPIDSWEAALIADGCILGTIIGQLVFGFLADQVGRKLCCIITTLFLLVGALGSGALSWRVGFVSLPLCLSFWRFVLGVGIGGEYPLSASMVAESGSSLTSEADSVEIPSLDNSGVPPKASKRKRRGLRMGAVFSFQGLGNLAAPIVFLLLLLCLGSSRLDLVWRGALIVGALPPAIIFIPRLLMKESRKFVDVSESSLSTDVTIGNSPSGGVDEKPVQKPSTPTILSTPIPWLVVMRHYGWDLVGTAGSWFLFDVVFYANGLFSGTLISTLALSDSSTSDYNSVVRVALCNLLICCLALPGYWFATLTVDYLGRKSLQLAGFLLMGLTFASVGFWFSDIRNSPWLFVSLYGFSFFAANAGPNTTTFILPAEAFPTALRSRFHGISAACGKLGALIGGAAMKPVLDSVGIGRTLVLCGAISLMGFVLTLCFVRETKSVSISALDLNFANLIRTINVKEELSPAPAPAPAPAEV